MNSAEPLSVNDFRKQLIENYQKAGVINELKTQLRVRVLSDLQQYSLSGSHGFDSEKKGAFIPLSFSKPEKKTSLKQKALIMLVMDFLKKSNYDYTLSIFLPESGMSFVPSMVEIVQALGLRTNENSMIGNLVKSIVDEKECIISCVLDVIEKYSEKRYREEDCQTSSFNSIDEELKKMDDEFIEKMKNVQNISQVSIEDRMLEFQRECERRAKEELQSKLKLYEETIVSAMRLEESTRYREKISKIREEMEIAYMKRVNALKSKELELEENFHNRERALEKNIYEKKQQIMNELHQVEELKLQVKREKHELEEQRSKLDKHQDEYYALSNELEQRMKAFEITENAYRKKYKDSEILEHTLKQTQKTLDTMKKDLEESRERNRKLENLLQEERRPILDARGFHHTQQALELKLQEEKSRNISLSNELKEVTKKLNSLKNDSQDQKKRLSSLHILEETLSQRNQALKEMKIDLEEARKLNRNLELKVEELKFEMKKQSTRYKEVAQKWHSERNEMIQKYENAILRSKDLEHETYNLRHMLSQNQLTLDSCFLSSAAGNYVPLDIIANASALNHSTTSFHHSITLPPQSNSVQLKHACKDINDSFHYEHLEKQEGDVVDPLASIEQNTRTNAHHSPIKLNPLVDQKKDNEKKETFDPQRIDDEGTDKEFKSPENPIPSNIKEVDNPEKKEEDRKSPKIEKLEATPGDSGEKRMSQQKETLHVKNEDEVPKTKIIEDSNYTELNSEIERENNSGEYEGEIIEDVELYDEDAILTNYEDEKLENINSQDLYGVSDEDFQMYRDSELEEI